MAQVLRDEHKLAEAEPYVRQALAMRRQLFGQDNPKVASTLNTLGSVLVLEEKYPDAERAFRESVTIRRKRFGNESWQNANAQSLLGDCLTKTGRLAEAESLVVPSYAILNKQFGPKHSRTQAALRRVVALYEKMGKPDKVAEYQALLAKN